MLGFMEVKWWGCIVENNVEEGQKIEWRKSIYFLCGDPGQSEGKCGWDVFETEDLRAFLLSYPHLRRFLKHWC